MQEEPTKIKYAQARHLYLEISNHPKTIEKFKEFGLSEEGAQGLAEIISQDVSNYEGALNGYKRDLWAGIALTITGLAAWFFLDTSGTTQYAQLKLVRWGWVGGLGLLWSAYSKRKVIKLYEKIDTQPY